jgi:hypothetical protein
VRGPLPASLIPTELLLNLVATGERDEEVRITLPATPGLAQIKEVVIIFGPYSQERPLDLEVKALKVEPIAKY